MENILVFGLGITGQSVLRTLKALNISAHGIDNNENILKELKEDYSVSKISDINLKDYCLIVKSPGIQPGHPFLEEARKENLEIISDLELSFRLFPDRKYINITGTNGKTTCSKLVYEMLNEGGLTTHLIGNIGVGMTWEIYNSSVEDFYVIETSSFQLHDTKDFRSFMATIINLEEDHLDWHGNYEAYKKDKFKIFDHQKTTDYSIINRDDEEILEYSKKLKTHKIEISLKEKTNGFYYEKEQIIDGETGENLISTDELKIKGLHNIQNALIASSMAKKCGVSREAIKKTLRNFSGLEHRLEYIGKWNHLSFYNDSKATNPESAVLAVESFDSVVLIAGGYDKKIDFKPFFEKIHNEVSGLVLMGETKDYFYDLSKVYQMDNVFLVESMEEAVEKAIDISEEESVILLSPASASWGMYDNFEQRGDHFKKIVFEKMRNIDE